MVEVVAALIFRGNKFLIAQRPKEKARAYLWEFVGGKVEKNETRVQALERECREELGVTVLPKKVYTTVEHVYPDLTVRLTLFLSEMIGEPKKIEHNDLKWITVDEIDDYPFCPADLSILEKIKRDYKPHFH